MSCPRWLRLSRIPIQSLKSTVLHQCYPIIYTIQEKHFAVLVDLTKMSGLWHMPQWQRQVKTVDRASSFKYFRVARGSYFTTLCNFISPDITWNFVTIWQNFAHSSDSESLFIPSAVLGILSGFQTLNVNFWILCLIAKSKLFILNRITCSPQIHFITMNI